LLKKKKKMQPLCGCMYLEAVFQRWG